MNPPDDQLSRLFRAARQTWTVPAAMPPYGMATHVTAMCRMAGAPNAGFWDTTLLVRGLILASVIMAISLWPVLKSTPPDPFSDYLQMADSTVPTDDAP